MGLGCAEAGFQILEFLGIVLDEGRHVSLRGFVVVAKFFEVAQDPLRRELLCRIQRQERIDKIFGGGCAATIALNRVQVD